MESKLVSVIIPIYNQELYLDISLTSVLNQQYSNLEIITVNDGSTDHSQEILLKYREIDKRIKIINQENGGLSDAVLTGIKNANGKYICFLDSDDRIGSDYIQNFIDKIEDNDFVATGFYYEYNDAIYPEKLIEDRVYSSNDIDEWRTQFLFDKERFSVSRQFYISRWNKMYKTDLLKLILEDYSKCKNVSLGEDTLFTYLVLSKAKSARTIRDVNSYYYNKKSQTSMTSNSKVDDHIKKSNYAADIFSSFLVHNGESEEQSLYLLYFLIEALFQRLKTQKNQKKEFIRLIHILRKNSQYIQSLNLIYKNSTIKMKIAIWVRKELPSRCLYYLYNIFTR